jgi:hypothetical protein
MTTPILHNDNATVAASLTAGLAGSESTTNWVRTYTRPAATGANQRDPTRDN